MKKAKTMLTAIAILAIVGGSLALKRKMSNVLFFLIFPNDPGFNCIVAEPGFKTSIFGFVGYYATTSSGNCLYGVYTITSN
jgi:hypothetical protein